MTTQYGEACRGRTTSAMEVAAEFENVPVSMVLEKVAAGHAVIPANPLHVALRPYVVGRAFTTKVNANIGRSPDLSSGGEELEKMNVAVSAGAHFVMDLSVGPNLPSVRKAILESCSVPLGTVPIYEAFARIDNDITKLDASVLLKVIREQAEEGVDFMTLHAGFLKKHVGLATKRLLGIASRGGAIMAEWMHMFDKENPLYSHWDQILDICFEHDVTVSLGDALRPGCLADASDEAQFAELDILGELVQKCRERHVQVMVEGPGHVPFDQIEANMLRQREVCDDAPFYVLGPVVTDIAPGYDHITSSIGATAAAYHGAALLCYVTPAEHLGLPTSEDVKTGVVAYRIAAHAADVAKGLPGARDIDDEMARARLDFNWKRQFELALDGDTAKLRYEQSRVDCGGDETDHCSMCGKDFCAVRTTKRLKESL
ncbi:MAG: phosphomethylpyrimidine synthase ThiC [Kiritimatiellae bacterium]|nr:phosphomethylpyrimidine synthase ThiC [Kiritimatiellia bacterium]